MLIRFITAWGQRGREDHHSCTVLSEDLSAFLLLDNEELRPAQRVAEDVLRILAV